MSNSYPDCVFCHCPYLVLQLICVFVIADRALTRLIATMQLFTNLPRGASLHRMYTINPGTPAATASDKLILKLIVKLVFIVAVLYCDVTLPFTDVILSIFIIRKHFCFWDKNYSQFFTKILQHSHCSKLKCNCILNVFLFVLHWISFEVLFYVILDVSTLSVMNDGWL